MHPFSAQAESFRMLCLLASITVSAAMLIIRRTVELE